jgi:citronellol/citronellal dehydrogenase
MIAPVSDEGRSSVFAAGMLAGKVALITGGGTGLGKESAAELCRCGAEVVITGRREDVLGHAAGEIESEVGLPDGAIAFTAGDVREVEEAQRIASFARERLGRLDILVNNAGGQYFTPAEKIAPKGWRAVWRLNVEGMLNMSEAAYVAGLGDAGRSGDVGRHAGGGELGDGGAPRREGTIVNVTLSPHHGMPGMAHSAAARAAVEDLTRELAQRWAGEGIAVSVIAAGHFETDAIQKYPESVKAGTSLSIPLGRMGRPEEHAWLVALLCSPVGSALSGTTITLDGARDNWFGPWPPPGLAGEGGEVPTEERRPGTG